MVVTQNMFWAMALKDISSWMLGLQKMSIFSESQWNEYNVNWKICLCFLLAHWWIDLILNTLAESDRMYKNTKHCTCPVEICLIFVFLTTVNTSWLQKDCTDFIITAAELINQGRPLLSPVSGTMIYIVNSLWRVEGQPLVAYKWPLSWG